MKAKHIILLLFTAISCFFASCNQDEVECPSSEVPYMIMGITNSSGLTFDSLYFSSDSLTDYLYSGTAIPSYVKIPLLLNSDTTLLNFCLYSDTLGTLMDTIILEYTMNLKMNNIECDFTAEFLLNAVTSTTHFIDSIIISSPTINEESNTHVEVYF